MGKRIPTTVKDQDLVAQRRGEIVDVATRLFLERGFHNTSIRDIARACPFNLASLYMYVSSKEDILFLVAQQLIDEKAKAGSNVFVMRAAARSLGQIKSRAGVDVLIATLTNETNDNDVRREAATALGLIGDTSAGPALQAAVASSDPYLAEAARAALRRLKAGKN